MTNQALRITALISKIQHLQSVRLGEFAGRTVAVSQEKQEECTRLIAEARAELEKLLQDKK